MEKTVKFESRDSIAYITLNRPDSLNAFDPAMFEDFNNAIDHFRDDDELKVAIVRGAGKRAFSAGVDLKHLATSLKQDAAKRAGPLVIRMAEPGYLDKPVIAAIRGYCVGEGIHVALACDFRVCASDAIFSVPEVAVGMPLIRLSSQCVRSIGTPAAVELCFLGEKKDANWALSRQLVHKVALPGEELALAEQIARRLCSVSLPALRVTKQTMARAHDMTYVDLFAYGMPLREQVFASGDAREATQAFASSRDTA